MTSESNYCLNVNTLQILILYITNFKSGSDAKVNNK